jgi:hypothetical protein
MAVKEKPGYENVKKISVGLNRRIAQHLDVDFPSGGLHPMK